MVMLEIASTPKSSAKYLYFVRMWKAAIFVLCIFLSLFSCDAQSGSSAGGIVGGNTWAKRGMLALKFS